MTDTAPKPQPTSTSTSTPTPAPDAGHMPMSTEMDGPRWSLPPVVPIVVSILVIGIIVFGVTRLSRPAPPIKASFTQVKAIELPSQERVLVSIGVRLENSGKDPVWIKSMEAKINTSSGELTDTPAPGAEVARYLGAYPHLKQDSPTPIAAEMKIPGGTTAQGIIIVGYAIPKAEFDARKLLTLDIDFYDRNPVKITQ
jgi:hypothetical protein